MTTVRCSCYIYSFFLYFCHRSTVALFFLIFEFFLVLHNHSFNICLCVTFMPSFVFFSVLCPLLACARAQIFFNVCVYLFMFFLFFFFIEEFLHVRGCASVCVIYRNRVILGINVNKIPCVRYKRLLAFCFSRKKVSSINAVSSETLQLHRLIDSNSFLRLYIAGGLDSLIEYT